MIFRPLLFNFCKKFFQENYQWQTVGIKIRLFTVPDLGQNFAKGYQQTTLAGKELKLFLKVI